MPPNQEHVQLVWPLWIVLSTEDKLPFLEQPIPVMPVPPEGQANPPDVVTTHQAWADRELFQTVQEFYMCKQEEGRFVSSYVLKMKSYIENLEHLGHAMTQNLSVSLILVSLRKEYDSFVQNYNMHSMGKTKNQKKKSYKAAKGNQGKGKAKIGYAPVQAPPFAPKPKNPPTPKKDNPAKDVICHQCGKVGHWRRNCPIYLSELMKKKKLSHGASTSAVEAFGNYHLCLPSVLVLILHNCHYAPSITRGIISVSRLYKDGFVNCFENDNSISVFKNNMIYFNAIPRDDIYEIVMSSSNTNECSMYVVTKKRSKLNLDSGLLWHSRLRHINKKHIEKLQHDRLLDSTDIKSFEKCVACMSGKMSRKPYSHQVERAKDLLGLIYTDVCGPFKIMSRQEAYYFVTFTDDYSRYGYVYLLKHQHEVFETFKVFQKEVENQLWKTIKSLRSDRGGEYMSQEFLDHLKDHGIIAHRTPPYTPQHNGASERRNKTLLDMVRSMMSQTTLPKSFWDYALESAACILNMVPAKKVDKTPYKVWHGQAPKLSYLKVWGCEALVKRDTLTKPDKLEPRAFKYQEASGSLEDLEIIQEEDTHPSIDTSLNHEEDDLEMDEPQSDIIPIRRSTRTRRPTDRMCLYIDAEEHELGDLDIRAIRILIAIAAYYDYEIWQMDVKTAFLNGYLNEEVYMEQPEGFVNPKYPNRVCKLKCSIYGLKQASRQWNKRFDDEIKKFGFSQNADEPCVYLKASGSNVTFLILYVDDILIMGNSIPMLQDVKSYLGKCFAMKDLGEAAYILGIKIYRDRSRRLIGLCQSAYIKKILQRYHMENYKRGSIPMQEKLRLSKSQGTSTPAKLKHMQNVPYVSAVGSIMYAVRCTRPDVAFAQTITSRFQQNPGAVDWKSVKQSIFATSSAETKYIAAYDASKEAVWVRKFIYGLGIVPTIEEPIKYVL
ncbi:putative retrotransposon protein [Tanacetum coccineum]|uniref:Retrotransposon protein n=1 Tax=Tanacetum coccineum TaxID=301880 RepID=A0ABQ5HZJ6_9ASTR